MRMSRFKHPIYDYLAYGASPAIASCNDMVRVRRNSVSSPDHLRCSCPYVGTPKVVCVIAAQPW